MSFPTLRTLQLCDRTLFAESKVTTNVVVLGFALLYHNGEPAPVVHGRGAEEEEHKTWLQAFISPFFRTSLVHFSPQRNCTAAPQKSELTGETSTSGSSLSRPSPNGKVKVNPTVVEDTNSQTTGATAGDR